MLETTGSFTNACTPAPDRVARHNALYWVDFCGPVMHRLDPATGGHRSWTLPAAPTIGSLAFAAGGRLVLALENGVCLFDPAGGRLTPFADPNAGRPGIGYNDAKVDRDRRYWVLRPEGIVAARCPLPDRRRRQSGDRRQRLHSLQRSGLQPLGRHPLLQRLGRTADARL